MDRLTNEQREELQLALRKLQRAHINLNTAVRAMGGKGFDVLNYQHLQQAQSLISTVRKNVVDRIESEAA